MNLFNGVFSKSSAFTKVQSDHYSDSQERKGRSMETAVPLGSSSSNPSLEGRRSNNFSAERYSSSSERDMSINSEGAGSLDRAGFSNMSPLITPNENFIKPKAVKPTGSNKFGFLQSCNMNGFSMHPSFYWMKYQMMMKPSNTLGEFKNLTESNHGSNLSDSLRSSNSQGDLNDSERMVGKLTAYERKQKVERYLQKKRKKSKMVRYECRKNLAQRRLRYQGRFISAKEAEKLDKSLIYDPNSNLVHKPIFHTFKDTSRWRKKCGYPRSLNSSNNSIGNDDS